MSKGLLFWILMVIWLIFGVWRALPDVRGGQWQAAAPSLLEFILFFLLGWAVFGFVVQ
jgi:hypothetical protein